MANITLDGQVTVPMAIRVALGIEPGDKVYIGVNSAGKIISRKAGKVRAKSLRPDRFESACD